MCFKGGMALESDLEGWWDVMLSNLACCPKSPALPLNALILEKTIASN